MTPRQIAGLISEDVSFRAGMIPEAILDYPSLKGVSITDMPWPILRDIMMEHGGDPNLFNEILSEFNRQTAQSLRDALNTFKRKYPDLPEDELYEYTRYIITAIKTINDWHMYTGANVLQLLQLRRSFYRGRAEITRELATTEMVDANDLDVLADALQGAADLLKEIEVNLVPEIKQMRTTGVR